MRLDCPKCGAKGDSRVTKTLKWRCSPAHSNGGCGYEWDDPDYNLPNVDYRNSELELQRMQRQLEWEAQGPQRQLEREAVEQWRLKRDADRAE